MQDTKKVESISTFSDIIRMAAIGGEPLRQRGHAAGGAESAFRPIERRIIWQKEN